MGATTLGVGVVQRELLTTSIPVRIRMEGVVGVKVGKYEGGRRRSGEMSDGGET